MKKIAFSGCRDATIHWRMANIIRQETKDCEVFVGCCPTGVDLFVREFCEEMKVPYTVFVADWGTYSSSAGPIRNKEMVKDADELIAFWDGKSKGTKNAIEEATKAGVPVRIYPI